MFFYLVFVGKAVFSLPELSGVEITAVIFAVKFLFFMKELMIDKIVKDMFRRIFKDGGDSDSVVMEIIAGELGFRSRAPNKIGFFQQIMKKGLVDAMEGVF